MKWYSNGFLPLLWQFLLIPYRTNKFVYLISKNVKIKIYRNVIFPVLLYGCKTWSLTLREEHRLRVFENRVSRRIFGPRRGENGS
jgi:hypothetical protein